MAEKNYIKGNGKKIEFQNGGYIINLNLKFEDLEKLPKEKGYIKLTLGERREKDEFGNTHYCYENDYKKDEKNVMDDKKYGGGDSSLDLPFNN